MKECQTYHRALSGGIAPRFIVTREDTHVATSHELLVVKTQDRVVAVQEIGVEDDLDAIAGAVKELDTTDLVEDWVGRIVYHVVGDNWRKGVSLESEDTAFQEDLILGVEEVVEFWVFRTRFTEGLSAKFLLSICQISHPL